MKKSRFITLAHGNGGLLTHELITRLYLPRFKSEKLSLLPDAAVFDSDRSSLAMTTDSFVVTPLFFPGSDIGELAVSGSINDLLMVGAEPLFLSLAFIIEEGFSFSVFEKILDSIARASARAGVKIITGDTKVVGKGSCDGIFINTAGIGRRLSGVALGALNIVPSDAIIVSGPIGRHGFAVLSERENLGLSVKSDCRSLERLILPLLKKFKRAIRFMRDPTRGGLATVLCEITDAVRMGALIEQELVPVDRQVELAGQMLGIDPLYMANEGCAVIVAENSAAGEIVSFLKDHGAKKAAKIGFMRADKLSLVVERTSFKTERIIEMLDEELLPRIC